VNGTVRDIKQFYQSGDLLLLSTGTAVYRWNTKLEGNPHAVLGLPRFRTIQAVGDKFLLGTVDGLILWNDRVEDSGETIYPEMGGIAKIYPVGDLILISADNGLYRWNDRLEGR